MSKRKKTEYRINLSFSHVCTGQRDVIKEPRRAKKRAKHMIKKMLHKILTVIKLI